MVRSVPKHCLWARTLIIECVGKVVVLTSSIDRQSQNRWVCLRPSGHLHSNQLGTHPTGAKRSGAVSLTVKAPLVGPNADPSFRLGQSPLLSGVTP